MKYLVAVIFFALIVTELPAQTQGTYNEDSVRIILEKTGYDTTRVKVLGMLAQSYFFKDPDSCLIYATEALELSRRLNYSRGILDGLFQSAEAMRQTGQLVDALKMQFESLGLSQKLNDKLHEANSLGYIGQYYSILHDYEEAIRYLKRALAIHKKIVRKPQRELFKISLGNCYSAIGQYDSAFFFIRSADVVFKIKSPQLEMFKLSSLGNTFFGIGRTDSATIYYGGALEMGLANRDVVPEHLSRAALRISEVFERKNQLDSSLYFAWYSYHIATKKNLNPKILEASQALTKLHRKNGNLDSAFYYKDIADTINERIYGEDKFRESQLLLSKEQRRNQEVQQAEERRQNKILLIGLVSITTVILVAAVLLFRSNRAKHKTNQALQKTLSELRSTQSQLIQSEKMASLGELTAGIAHEIQNPLNFVNNFAEVNKELIADMEAAIQDGNLEEAKDLARNIADNQEKINSHGKRADAIVKSMMQHSRASSGIKEPTDINALCDEYLRLAYHGLRAKDKALPAGQAGFNAIPINIRIETDFDPTLGKINVIPQDIGRVILNLINNAFYAVAEKQKQNVNGFEPTVWVSTKVLNAHPDEPVGRGKVEIKVADNGNGIPDDIKEKIFQPFFTTKPTGQGTGLGLSLSYDIIKAHGGDLKVETKGAHAAQFTILLPIK